MYINKGIYTYIPNPDPETPNPKPRRPRLGEENEQLFGLFFRQCKKQQDIWLVYRKQDKKKGHSRCCTPNPEWIIPISSASTRSYRMLPVALRLCFGWGSPPILIGSDHRSAHILLPNSLPRYNHLSREAFLLHMCQHILKLDTLYYSFLTRLIPIYPTHYYMSTLNIKKFIKNTSTCAWA